MKIRSLVACGTLLLAALVATATVTQAAGGALTYTGHQFSDPHSEITVRVKPGTGTVKIRNIKVACDLGPQRIDLPKLAVERRRGDWYEGEKYVVGDGAELYYRVRMQVFGDHRVVGDIVYFRNGFGDTDPSYDCSARGAIAWRATR